MPASGETIKAEILNENTYTPVLTAATTNPTLGSSSAQAGWWKRVDNMIVGGARIQFGTSGAAAGSGTYLLSLPYAADTTIMDTSTGSSNGSIFGSASVRDNSTGSRDVGVCGLYTDGANVWILVSAGLVNNAAPWTWAASDSISVSFAYQADSTTF